MFFTLSKTWLAMTEIPIGVLKEVLKAFFNGVFGK